MLTFVQDSQQRVLSKIDGHPAGIPLVSAIIPAYNAAEFIHRAIESAIAQTHRLFEIIVVDDGSVDNTSEVASRYPVTVIRQANGGQASARNTGARAASGEWLAFLDHDDSWHREKTEQQLKFVRPGISAVFSEKVPHTGEVSFAQMFARNYGGNPSSTIIRADVLRQLGMFDEDRGLMGVDDYNLWLRFVLEGYKFAATPKYYEFTPAENHYGGDPEKMLSAELVNLDKISAIAGLDPEVTGARRRLLRLAYLPDLVAVRRLRSAREQLKHLGFSRETAKYCVAFLPAWILDLRRAIMRSSRRKNSPS